MRDARGPDRFAALLLAALPMVCATPALAQQPITPFEQIQFKVEEGDAVDVTDTSGKVLRGSLLKATDTDLLVDVRGEVRRYSASDVAEVRARVFDKLWEGALIGTAVGAGFGALMAAQVDCYQDECAALIVGFGGAGAGIGIGIDALIRRFTLVYSAPGRPSTPQVLVLPIAGNGTRGAAVAVRF